ncbi:uncharacterized protein LOC125099001 isoform X3 [Lutra lutra]|uniref:uncharacterized protein LOC125099001 isoform X3 n=1 Tax=Lutra lutra TaxID=9657 RepID=UPI001FD0EA62|nr:uncharacterized protein LOC125099001 isoform X3 [Lutra lutra]
MPRGFFLLLSGFVMVCSQVRCVWGSWRLLIWFFPPAAFKTEVLHLKIPGMIGIKKDPLARKMRIRLSVLPGLKQCHHGLPRVVLTFTFSPTDVTALRNSSICRGGNATRWSLRMSLGESKGSALPASAWSERGSGPGSHPKAGE